MSSEKLYENKIKAYLKSIGAYFIKTHGDRFSKVGTPDILACINSHFVAVEVKAANGKPSELQLYNLMQIEKAGGFGYIAIPAEGVERLEKYIAENYPQYKDVMVIDFENFKKDMDFLLTSH